MSRGIRDRPGRYTENHKPKVNISRFLEKNRTEKKIYELIFEIKRTEKN